MRLNPPSAQLAFAEFQSDPREPSLFDIVNFGLRAKETKPMSTTNVTPLRSSPTTAELIESVIIRGDLSGLSAEQKSQYYLKVCETVGLNPVTKPFEFIKLNEKLVLYALKSCTEQLRTIHKVSVLDLTESDWDGVFMVTAKVQNGEGRLDVAKGAVNIAGLKGEALANALMKAETKAKRRATLSICGLGLLDEVEIDDMREVGNPAITQQAQPKSARAAKAKPTDTVWEEDSERKMTPDELHEDAENTIDQWGDRRAAELKNAMRANAPDLAEDIATQRAIVVDEIKNLITLHAEPTDERQKIELLQTHFKTISWTEIMQKTPLQRLRAGYDTMHFTLTGKPSKYHQERMAQIIQKPDDGIPANLRRARPTAIAAE